MSKENINFRPIFEQSKTELQSCWKNSCSGMTFIDIL